MLKLAGLVQYVPLPVIGGYLSFVGWFCTVAGVGRRWCWAAGLRGSRVGPPWPSVRGMRIACWLAPGA